MLLRLLQQNGSVFVCKTINVVQMISDCRSNTNNCSTMRLTLILVSPKVLKKLCNYNFSDFSLDSAKPRQRLPNREERDTWETRNRLSLSTSTWKHRIWTWLLSLFWSRIKKLKDCFREWCCSCGTARLSKLIPWRLRTRFISWTPEQWTWTGWTWSEPPVSSVPQQSAPGTIRSWSGRIPSVLALGLAEPLQSPAEPLPALLLRRRDLWRCIGQTSRQCSSHTSNAESHEDWE